MNSATGEWIKGWMDGSGAEPVSSSGGSLRRSARKSWRKEGSEMSSKQHSISVTGSSTGSQTHLHQAFWPHPKKKAVFVTYLTLPSFFKKIFTHKSLANGGSLCTGFPFYRPSSLLFDHLDPEGDSAQELISLVIVADVRALYPALHRQLLVVVLLGEQQLHSHQGLDVILLYWGWDSHLSIVHHFEDVSRQLNRRIKTYMSFLAVVGEIHLINTPLTGEILHLNWDVSLQKRASVKLCGLDSKWNAFCKFYLWMRHFSKITWDRTSKKGKAKTVFKEIQTMMWKTWCVLL